MARQIATRGDLLGAVGSGALRFVGAGDTDR
jgi:hypothetical protein